MGLGVFVTVARSLRLPLRRLRAYQGKHSFLSGLLVDSQCSRAVLTRLVEFFLSSSARWDCIEFGDTRPAGPLMTQLQACGAAYGLWLEAQDMYLRPVLFPAASHAGKPAGLRIGKRLKQLRRQRRKFAEEGALTWRLVAGGEAEIGPALERLAVLENLGWKGDRGTSLLASEQGRSFLREFGRRLSRGGQVFVAELYLDAEPVASVSVLVCADTGFIFKIGFDPRFGRHSPGLLNFLYLTEQVGLLLPGLRKIDSGTTKGSFLSHFWSASEPLATMLLPVNRFARVALRGRRLLRALRSALRGLTKATGSSARR